MPNIVKPFDTILNDMITDVLNQNPAADVSQGTLIFSDLAAAAAQMHNLYNAAEYVRRQIHPDTSVSANLERHCASVGITRQPGGTDSELLDRLLRYRSEPPAGGNQFDYRYWAESVTGVAYAKSYENARGSGTVDVLIVADFDLDTPDSEIPSAALLAEVFDVIDPLRPTGMRTDDGGPINPVEIIPVTIFEQGVVMTVSGNVDTDAITADIEAYMNGLEPDQTLDPSQLSALAIANGVSIPAVSEPPAIVIPALGEMIRPGVIDVSKV